MSDRIRVLLVEDHTLVRKGIRSLLGAEADFVSVKTVEAHKSRIMSKLEINNMAQLVKYAIRKGLTALDE